MSYRIHTEEKRGAIVIKANVKYVSWEIFKNPKLLIDNNFFTVDKGQKLYDLIAYCDPTNFAISEKVKNILEENNVTGWSCYPIIIEGIKENYFGFQITGKGGEVTNRDQNDDVPMFEPVKWNQSKWDGSDIFNIQDTGIKACTEKVKEILEKAKITNLEIKPL